MRKIVLSKMCRPDHKLVHNIPPDSLLSEAEVSVPSKCLKCVPLKPSINKYNVTHNWWVVVVCCCCFFLCFFLDERHLLDILPNVRSDLMIILFTTLFRSPNHRERRHDTHPEVESYMHQMF